MPFYCINDGVPRQTVEALRASCAAREIDFVEVDARMFDFTEGRRLSPGDMLYRPATSLAAMRVEQFLVHPQAASFYAGLEDIYFSSTTPTLHFEYAGLPIPTTFYCSTTNRAIIKSFVERLGGLPVVVKALGYSGGVGVIRADSYPALFSVVDFALAQNHNPLLCAYMDQAVHWRYIVLGDTVIAAYRNAFSPDDFRTQASREIGDYTQPIFPEFADLAIRAVRTLRLEFGGVDLLERTDGSAVLLEANFPCYFLHAQEVAGVDISGQMVDYLRAKAERLKQTDLFLTQLLP